MTGDERVTILDVTDELTFARIPACADPGFDHRSCDYWEDAGRGSKAARLSWLEPTAAGDQAAAPTGRAARTRSSPISPSARPTPVAPFAAAALPGATRS